MPQNDPYVQEGLDASGAYLETRKKHRQRLAMAFLGGEALPYEQTEVDWAALGDAAKPLIEQNQALQDAKNAAYMTDAEWAQTNYEKQLEYANDNFKALMQVVQATQTARGGVAGQKVNQWGELGNTAAEQKAEFAGWISPEIAGPRAVQYANTLNRTIPMTGGVVDPDPSKWADSIAAINVLITSDLSQQEKAAALTAFEQSIHLYGGQVSIAALMTDKAYKASQKNLDVNAVNDVLRVRNGVVLTAEESAKAYYDATQEIAKQGVGESGAAAVKALEAFQNDPFALALLSGDPMAAIATMTKDGIEIKKPPALPEEEVAKIDAQIEQNNARIDEIYNAGKVNNEPPMVQAKREVMADPAFADFKESRGYGPGEEERAFDDYIKEAQGALKYQERVQAAQQTTLAREGKVDVGAGRKARNALVTASLGIVDPEAKAEGIAEAKRVSGERAADAAGLDKRPSPSPGKGENAPPVQQEFAPTKPVEQTPEEAANAEVMAKGQARRQELMGSNLSARKQALLKDLGLEDAQL